MSKRKIFVLVSSLIVVACMLVGGIWATTKNDVTAANELPGARFVRQLVAADNSTARTIMWQTDADEALQNPEVEYRVVGADSKDSMRVTAKAESFTDDGESVMLYTAELVNLSAGASMEYRICGNGAVGVWHPMQMDKGDKFAALIFPDSQSNDYSGWKNIAQGAAARHPESAFFVNMGDLVDNGEDANQWEGWFEGVEGIMERIPAVPVMGNHETYDLNWKIRQPAAYLNNFALPANGSSRFNRYYYSYDYGPVHFIVLNTQQSELEELSPDLMAEQLAWFKQDVAASTKPWKVVLMHRDTLQYRIHNRPERLEGFSDEGMIWMPLFDEAGIDAVLSAHLHTYRNRGHIKNFERDASGPLYLLSGVAGNVRYPGLWIDHALDEYVAPQPETDNYMYMEASSTELNFYSYLSDGTMLDHAVLNK